MIHNWFCMANIWYTTHELQLFYYSTSFYVLQSICVDEPLESVIVYNKLTMVINYELYSCLKYTIVTITWLTYI